MTTLLGASIRQMKLYWFLLTVLPSQNDFPQRVQDLHWILYLAVWHFFDIRQFIISWLSIPNMLLSQTSTLSNSFTAFIVTRSGIRCCQTAFEQAYCRIYLHFLRHWYRRWPYELIAAALYGFSSSDVPLVTAGDRFKSSIAPGSSTFGEMGNGNDRITSSFSKSFEVRPTQWSILLPNHEAHESRRLAAA